VCPSTSYPDTVVPMSSLPAERGPQGPRAVRAVLQATLFPDYEPTEPSIGFLARAFIVATLPHSRPAGNEFTRRNGYYAEDGLEDCSRLWFSLRAFHPSSAPSISTTRTPSCGAALQSRHRPAARPGRGAGGWDPGRRGPLWCVLYCFSS
jgi:hypothetical protein